MEIALHLGAHRCASTTFQNYVWGNHSRLAQRGLTCWTPRRTRNGLLAGMLRHPAMITLADEHKAVRSVGRMRIGFDRLAASGQDAVLISEENIIGSMRNNLLDTRLYPLLGERLMRFKPAFEGHKLRIGLSIRSYEDFWASSLAQLLTRGGALPTVDLLDFLTTQPRRWRHVVQDVALTFPEAEVIVWPFERLAGQPNSQLQLLWDGDCRGLDESEIWSNRSADVPRLNDILRLRGKSLDCGKSFQIGSRWMPFDEDQRRVLRAEYRRDLAWLADGAEGHATFFDGRTEPANVIGDGRSTHAPMFQSAQNNGPKRPAYQPDRAEVTRTDAHDAVLFGGRQNGIEKGMGRTGAV